MAGAVFLDVDETLIRCNSMLDFLEFHLGELREPVEEFQAVSTQLRALARAGATRQAVAEVYFRSFAGSSIRELTDRGRRWFRIKRESPGFFSEAVLDRVRWHQRHGELIVLVSGSLSACVRPIADSIGAELAYSTELAISAGVNGDAHPDYREFHRKDDLSGLWYWRITGGDVELGEKELYDPAWAAAKIEGHAQHFVTVVEDETARWRARSDQPGIICAAYDAELFGHWWFEGVQWLARVLELVSSDSIQRSRRRRQAVMSAPTPQPRRSICHPPHGAATAQISRGTTR